MHKWQWFFFGGIVLNKNRLKNYVAIGEKQHLQRENVHISEACSLLGCH